MSIEVRYDEDRKVDEIVGQNCSVHLERLDGNSWCLIVETDKGRGHFSIRGKGVKVSVVEINTQPDPRTGPNNADST